MNENLLIADSGSTKTDWALGSLRLKTQGINPFHQDDDSIRHILHEELLPQLPNSPTPQLPNSPITSIHFYGSGVRPELEPRMERLLREAFPAAQHVEAHGDLLGAARALCGRHEGIACILGTGANSCLYDGERIVQNTPPLGYILGDEGSGAVLGVRFLNALYKGRLPEELRREFEATTGLTLAAVIEHVYRQPLANRWLASLSVFIREHVSLAAVHELVVSNFRDFIRLNVKPYQRPDLPLSAVGSIAFYYAEQLEEAADKEGYAVGTILRSPIDGLVNLE